VLSECNPAYFCRKGNWPEKSSNCEKVPVRSEAQVMGNRPERKHRRFPLECPVYVRFKTSGSPAEVETTSKNLSIGGLLLRSTAMIPEYTPVTFIICVRGGKVLHPIYLTGEGEIARVEGSGAAFVIAIKCRIPITQLEDYLAEM
jgi:PilZ domain